MASNPPFHMEDQDDEDFFDKLVEDDVGPDKSGYDDQANDFDDVKAFSNLGVGVDASAFGNSSVGGSGGEVKEKEKEKEKEDGGNGQDGVNSFGCDDFTYRGDHGMESGNSSGSSVSKNTGIPSSDVKEKDWNAFNADSSGGGVGFGSYSDFFSEFGDQNGNGYHDDSNTEMKLGNEIPGDQYGQGYHNSNTEMRHGNEILSDGLNASVDYAQYQDGQSYDASARSSICGEDLNSSQYWESLYPGWKYDHNTGQWYQVDDHNATIAALGSSEVNTAMGWMAASDAKPEVSYMQQTAQSVAGTLPESGITETVPSWNQGSQVNNGYPEHMIFDPQYPGWYYDTIAQEWGSLESYNSSVQSAFQGLENGHVSTGTFLHNGNNLYRDYGQASYYESQSVGSQVANNNWIGSYGINQQQGLDTLATATATKSGNFATYGGNQQFDHSFGSSVSVNKDQQNASSSFGSVPFYNKVNNGHGLANGIVETQRFAPSGNFGQHFNYSNTQFDEQKNFSNDYVESKQPFGYSNQSFHGGQQHSYAPHVKRSSAGRPPHALVTFGFGGKLVLMKDSSLSSSTYESQSVVQGSISVLNLMEVVSGSIDSSSIGNGAGDYFRALGQQSVPGPLIGGSVGSKELNKWIDERIAHCRSSAVDYKKSERMRLLLSLLKIACQYYGKLRSPFGTDAILKENDTPGSAVARLFASAKMNGKECGVLSHCLQNWPSEAQMRATASEVQNRLVSGKKKEALQYAQEGQMWGPALVVASQLGEKYYVDTVRQMALRQLVAGSPLRTLCLLIAGQPAEVFSSDSSNSVDPSALNMPQHPAQFGSIGMLDDWEENLAVITANRTKDDELVIIHLGDCLWKERSQIIAAHICYLIAEANFESYSDTARLCLLGADHWKFPRTYANPEAIQRTELYEYSKVLGNSQFILLPFQPYKLIYAYMLAEVGKVSDSLKYCQAVLKSLKTGRAPEVETWKQMLSSLEERIRTHQQGGYAANLAPGKLVGKLLNFFDSTAHRVVGGLPPPAPSSSSQGIVHGNEQNYQPGAHRVSNSQSTMAMSSLVSSDSMEPISEWTADNNKKTKPNRSVSEPDFGRSPRQETSPDSQSKATGGTSRFSRFGFGSQLLQKITVGLVLKPRPGKQAKLGEKNKFYYDENLKRWVEEGAEPPAEETALAPPPTTATFQNGLTDYNLKSALKTEGTLSKDKTSNPELTPGFPPIPPSTGHFSARGRVGIRSRYVDTFNQGGGNSTNMFQSPSIPTAKPIVAANAKFFIPAPAPSLNEQTMEAIDENNHEDNLAYENPSTSYSNDWSFQSPKPPPPLARQRCPSVGNFADHGAVVNGSNCNSPHSRRTVSWGGSPGCPFSPTKTREIMPLGEALGMPPSTYMSDDVSLMRSPMGSGSFGEDLHEVDL
ncbi:protein transport protein SEC16B homolog [Trifolium pratense]|uniref:protein transport protein SEC16B homolog n=1 Tax=Trifolium pratense TaxID=57577 RepID=UPI001E693382|nr:protein transport protein SEC16B homolog [Trifolium pratense]